MVIDDAFRDFTNSQILLAEFMILSTMSSSNESKVAYRWLSIVLCLVVTVSGFCLVISSVT